MRVNGERLDVRRARGTWSVLLGVTLFMMAVPATAQDRVVIPYHGLLTDSGGGSVDPDAPLTLRFNVYRAREGGAPEWSETHGNVAVVGGRFSVLLGDTEPFPEDLGVFFGRTVYVGVTVDNGDPDVAEVEMRPRQAIVPVVASRWAADADRATVADRALAADRATMADRALAADRAVVADQVLGEVPVGGVTMFHGDAENLPSNWLICDGQGVDDPDSPLNGQTVPDLRGLFVRGADIEGRAVAMGGVDYEPAHNHSVVYPGGGAGDSVVGRTGRAGGHDNRPGYMELHYIIRIR